MPEPRFPFWPFFLALFLVMGAAAGINWGIDPLWYSKGNRITGRNFVFNERIEKANLLVRTLGDGYDCLILGSSRVTGLHAKRFAGQHCFNLALKGAESQDLLAFGRFARDIGLRPKTVYVGVDDFNFIFNKVTARRSNPQVTVTPNLWQAFFSADVLLFSAMTLANVSPDANVYYDRDFELQEFRASTWHPEIQQQIPLECSFDRVAQYREIRQLFPQARVVAYAPLMSPWYLLNDVYLRRVLDCEAEGFHAVSEDYDSFLDFGIPSAVSSVDAFSYDGSHFSPQANDAVVDELIGRRTDLAIEVKGMSLEDYRAELKRRLKEFVDRNHLQSYWTDQ